MWLRPSVDKKKSTSRTVVFIVRFRTQKQDMLCLLNGIGTRRISEPLFIAIDGHTGRYDGQPSRRAAIAAANDVQVK
ncbi:hypothetical protein [Caballeronia arationis]|jgi:hypothetical protein|uniref:hypothetical protein n=1 Tax=Caballeronia arationis TaxID=1777142 RepID=UPI00117C6EAC|nr:hypothetical protein [Caballeronia arationis]